MEKEDLVYVQHIRDAILKVEKYTRSCDYDDFKVNDLIQDGVIRQIEIIGEATKRLSPEFRGKYPILPWKDIAGMRDKLIHHYLGVDIEAVWKTVKEDIPLLKREIGKILG